MERVNGTKQTYQKKSGGITAHTLPPAEKKRSVVSTVIVLLILGVVFAFFFFYDDLTQRKETVIPVAGITSAQGKIISISPEKNSFDIEMNLLVRHENGTPIYEIQTKKINVSDTAQTFDPKGKITKEDFFKEANVGDTVYIAADDILKSSSIDAHLLIIDFNELEEE